VSRDQLVKAVISLSSVTCKKSAVMGLGKMWDVGAVVAKLGGS